MNKSGCLILIFQFLLVLSQPSIARTESDFCETCKEHGTSKPTIVTALPTEQLQGWTTVNVPYSVQTSQMDAGLPKGCVLTSMLYTLKFGSKSYQNAYASIHGTSDTEKLRSLVDRFSKLKSKDKPDDAAFSEQYGTNPNDLAWMFQSLVPESEPLKLETFLAELQKPQSSGKKLLRGLHEAVRESLSSGRPVIANLLYENPSFGHAVVITGIENVISEKDNFLIRVLDPATGIQSLASVTVSTLKFGEHDLQSLSYTSLVNSRTGTLLSVAH